MSGPSIRQAAVALLAGALFGLGLVISGMTEADGEEDTSYRYLLMPILRF